MKFKVIVEDSTFDAESNKYTDARKEEIVEATGLNIGNDGTVAFYRSRDEGVGEVGMRLQPVLVLALRAGSWDRIEEVQD